MADFKTAYKITCNFEGGYVNDPADRGGETYKGVARRFHPNWRGWPIIDGHKSHHGISPRTLNSILQRDTALQTLVESFYKAEFWDRMRLDSVNHQFIANEMFDTGVNMGIRPAVTMTQEALNLLNRNQTDYPNRTVDGLVGPNTLGAINNHPRPKNLFNLMNILQGYRYVEISKGNETQERFLHGWLDRVELMR